MKFYLLKSYLLTNSSVDSWHRVGNLIDPGGFSLWWRQR